MAFARYNPCSPCCCQTTVFCRKALCPDGDTYPPFWPEYLEAPGTGVRILHYDGNGNLDGICYPGLDPSGSGLCVFNTQSNVGTFIFEGGDFIPPYMRPPLYSPTSLNCSDGSGAFTVVEWQNRTVCCPCWMPLNPEDRSINFGGSWVGPDQPQNVWCYGNCFGVIYANCLTEPTGVGPVTSFSETLYFNNNIDFDFYYNPPIVGAPPVPASSVIISDIFLLAKFRRITYCGGAGPPPFDSFADDFFLYGQFQFNCGSLGGGVPLSVWLMPFFTQVASGDTLPPLVQQGYLFNTEIDFLDIFNLDSYNCNPFVLSLSGILPQDTAPGSVGGIGGPPTTLTIVGG